MSNSANKAYKFQIVNGTVTAVYKIENGRIQNDGMDHDESWSLDGGNVVKTQWDDGRLETTTYSDANGDGIFFAVSKTYANSQGTATLSGDDDLLGNSYLDDSNDNEFGSDTETHSETHSIESDGYEHQIADSNHNEVQGSLTNQNAISGSDGDDILSGGNHNDVLDGGNGSDTLRAGTGDDILVGGGRDDQGINHFEGGDGDDILVAGGQKTNFFGDFFSANATLNVVIHTDTKFAGVANILDGLANGLGNQVENDFHIHSGNGNDAILNFHAETDHITLDRGINGSNIQDFESLSEHITVQGNNMHIDLGQGNSITLVGIDPNSVSANDFVLI